MVKEVDSEVVVDPAMYIGFSDKVEVNHFRFYQRAMEKRSEGFLPIPAHQAPPKFVEELAHPTFRRKLDLTEVRTQFGKCVLCVKNDSIFIGFETDKIPPLAVQDFQNEVLKNFVNDFARDDSSVSSRSIEGSFKIAVQRAEDLMRSFPMGLLRPQAPVQAQVTPKVEKKQEPKPPEKLAERVEEIAHKKLAHEPDVPDTSYFNKFEEQGDAFIKAAPDNIQQAKVKFKDALKKQSDLENLENDRDLNKPRFRTTLNGKKVELSHEKAFRKETELQFKRNQDVTDAVEKLIEGHANYFTGKMLKLAAEQGRKFNANLGDKIADQFVELLQNPHEFEIQKAAEEVAKETGWEAVTQIRDAISYKAFKGFLKQVAPSFVDKIPKIEGCHLIIDALNAAYESNSFEEWVSKVGEAGKDALLGLVVTMALNAAIPGSGFAKFVFELTIKKLIIAKLKAEKEKTKIPESEKKGLYQQYKEACQDVTRDLGRAFDREKVLLHDAISNVDQAAYAIFQHSGETQQRSNQSTDRGNDYLQKATNLRNAANNAAPDQKIEVKVNGERRSISKNEASRYADRMEQSGQSLVSQGKTLKVQAKVEQAAARGLGAGASELHNQVQRAGTTFADCAGSNLARACSNGQLYEKPIETALQVTSTTVTGGVQQISNSVLHTSAKEIVTSFSPSLGEKIPGLSWIMAGKNVCYIAKDSYDAGSPKMFFKGTASYGLKTGMGILGTVAIPVPFFGTFVGGVVGDKLCKVLGLED